MKTYNKINWFFVVVIEKYPVEVIIIGLQLRPGQFAGRLKYAFNWPGSKVVAGFPIDQTPKESFWLEFLQDAMNTQCIGISVLYVSTAPHLR